MAEQLTEQQKMAVEDRGGKLLISAAAGSGKTKVLVDRLLRYLTEGKGRINIDDFLIITYTKAAAAELRVKIAAKLNERLAEQPDNRFLQHQIQRLYLTKISTVHGFCTDILRQYAHLLDIPGDFRVAEEQEAELLQVRLLDKLLERVYTEGDPDFYAFVDSQEYGRNDRSIPKIVLQVYKSARCHINPDGWLDQCASYNACEDITAVEETIWGKYLIEDLHQYLDMQIEAMKKCCSLAQRSTMMEKPAALLESTISQLVTLRSLDSWDDIVAHRDIAYGSLRFSSKCTDQELIEKIKAIRNDCKEGVEKKLVPFADKASRVMEDLRSCAQATRGLIKLVKAFSKEYDSLKRSKKLLDFSDLEHKALDLLVGKKRQRATAYAQEIGSRFVEIMVDEYQDSNGVQEGIFAALTEQRQNCFMVGDVKQSIYQFRVADPSIFLEKYHSYGPAEEAQDGQGRKVILSSNFRSAGPVIQAVNDVFTCCMSPKVGGLHYGTEEALHEGIPHISVPEQEIEFHVLDIDNDTYAEEASFVANRIAELLDGTHMVRQGDTLRPIVPEDIVILLRSPNSVGGEFQYALEQKGIPVNFGNGSDLLASEEIGFVRAMLQIIDNPMQDIPLMAVLTSRVFCFTADELAQIRASGSKRKTLYASLCKSESSRVKDFLELLKKLRKTSQHCTLSQLIDKIYSRLKAEVIFSTLENGDIRLSNLQSFSRLAAACETTNNRELSDFLDYLDAMEEAGQSPVTEKNVSGAVTIMSIHKSKGLEFPVVFLSGLSRGFNREDIRAQVLCHKELGIGLNCVDLKNRIRYPSISKKAIAARMIADSVSEELRILYVAMTRARDRLIMTFALNNPEKYVQFIANRMDYSAPELITSTVSCPGTWVLMTALKRVESGQLFALGSRPENIYSYEPAWKVTVNTVTETADDYISEPAAITEAVSRETIETIRNSLAYRYPHIVSTKFPSKETATQLKGREKDQEAAENTKSEKRIFYHWRAPAFANRETSAGTAFGNTVHTVMQYIDYAKCNTLAGVQSEISRMVRTRLIEESASACVDAQMIYSFFQTDFGKRLCAGGNILREFKFSILDDASKYDCHITGDQILLQGVIDCAIIDADGISVVDFKTDRVTKDTAEELAQQYRQQVLVYAHAISRIYQKKVVSARLYFFRTNQYVTVV